jgi:hypothetical protein
MPSKTEFLSINFGHVRVGTVLKWKQTRHQDSVREFCGKSKGNKRLMGHTFICILVRVD